MILYVELLLFMLINLDMRLSRSLAFLFSFIACMLYTIVLLFTTYHQCYNGFLFFFSTI